MAASSKSRNWCFTINNPTEEDEKSIKSVDGDYVYQRERGAEGTEHLQGVVMFNNARSFKNMKKINKKAHWEVSRNKMASVKYCMKEDTRIGETQGKGALYDKLTKVPEEKSMLKEGMRFKAECMLNNLIDEGNDYVKNAKMNKKEWEKLINIVIDAETERIENLVGI